MAWRCAHKHTDTPDVETIEAQIVTGVLNEISLYFDFSDGAVGKKSATRKQLATVCNEELV